VTQNLISVTICALNEAKGMLVKMDMSGRDRPSEQEYIWRLEYGERSKYLPALCKIFDEHKNLNMTAVFINNVVYNLECYILLNYYPLEDLEIEDMHAEIEEMFSDMQNAGAEYCHNVNKKVFELGNSDNTLQCFSTLDSKVLYEKMTTLNDKFWYPELKWYADEGFFINNGYDYTEDPKVFLSHKSENKEDVKKIMSFLNGRDFPAWLDLYDIKQSDLNTEIIKTEITQGIKNSHVAILWITNKYLKSCWCKFELDMISKSGIQDENCIVLIDAEIERENFERSKCFQIIKDMNCVILGENETSVSIARNIDYALRVYTKYSKWHSPVKPMCETDKNKKREFKM